MDKFIKFAMGVVFGLVIISSITVIYSSTVLDTVEKCKVLDLQQQQIISGSSHSMSTEIRYLVITDKETFVCEGSLINLKFNNSDIFFRLKKDSVYTFKVSGIGKTLFTDYRNILQMEK